MINARLHLPAAIIWRAWLAWNSKDDPPTDVLSIMLGLNPKYSEIPRPPIPCSAPVS